MLMILRFKLKLQFQEGELIRVQSELTRLIATHETSIRKQQEVMKEIEKLSETKKSAENNVATLEQHLNTLKEDNVKLKKMLELSEREKKLLEKNVAKVNGK